jgi:DNA-directed RNA polymerase specialized sigma subunit
MSCHELNARPVVREIEGWLDEYATTRDPALRDRIVMAYLEIAARLASRFHEHPPIAREDLQQTARMGLVAAVERYDPGRGVPFLIVLYYFHELRQRDIAERLGCSQMQVSRLLSQAVHRLRAMLLVPPDAEGVTWPPAAAVRAGWSRRHG